MVITPPATVAEIDRDQRELFKAINGFTDEDCDALRRYCLKLDETWAPGSKPR